jgi:hypothetical protein
MRRPDGVFLSFSFGATKRISTTLSAVCYMRRPVAAAMVPMTALVAGYSSGTRPKKGCPSRHSMWKDTDTAIGGMSRLLIPLLCLNALLLRPLPVPHPSSLFNLKRDESAIRSYSFPSH